MNRVRLPRTLLAIMIAALWLVPAAPAASRPDLLLTMTSNPPAATGAGKQLYTHVDAANKGHASAGHSTVKVWFSFDRHLSNGDLLLGSGPAPALKPRDERRLAIHGVVPGTLGRYYVIACVDARHKVHESKESNNCRASSKPTVVMPVPARPKLTSVTPTGPSADRFIVVHGTAVADSTILVFTNASCTKPYIGSTRTSAGGVFASNAKVPADATVSLHVSATTPGGTSGCSTEHVVYTNDSTEPEPATGLDTSPSVSGNDPRPWVTGTAEHGATVTVYRGSSLTCTTLVGSDVADPNTGSFGVHDTTGYANGETRTYAVEVSDEAGNSSGCGADTVSYTYQGPPAAPTVTVDDSPANENQPTVHGTAEPGSDVTLFDGSGCTASDYGPYTADGGGNWSATPGDIVVLDDTTTALSAWATNLAGTSECSTDFDYVEDSTALAPDVTGVAPTGPGNTDTPTVSGTLTSEPFNVWMVLYTDAGCNDSVGSGVATGPNWSVDVGAGNLAQNTPYQLYARFTDEAGNASPCSTTWVAYSWT